MNPTINTILERDALTPMKMSELRELMVALGGAPLQNETKEQLIDRLILSSAQQPPAVAENADAEEAPQQVVREQQAAPECTIEQVREAVGKQILLGMKVFHNPKQKTWLFRVKLKSLTLRDTNTGEIVVQERYRDDSGTLCQPITTIVRCAQVLMQGAPKLTPPAPPKDPSKGFTEVA